MRKPDALIVIDVQQALVDELPNRGEKLLSAIGLLIQTCRAAEIPVIFVQHEEAEGVLIHGTPGWEIAAPLTPRLQDARFCKRYSSAFRETNLHAHLQTAGIHNLLLCGMQTEYCVDTTCKVAFELGYSVTLPRGGTATYDNRLFKAADLATYYEWYIWRLPLAETVAMETLLTDLGHRNGA